MSEKKYTIQGLEEYIRQSEPDKRERGEVWRVAIGLQQVDGLTVLRERQGSQVEF